MSTAYPMQPQSDILLLGIETSCDETAAAVVRRTATGGGQILSNVIRAQWEAHRAFGGVVPEIAARAHVECLDGVIAKAMRDASLSFEELDAVAVTAGPGLIGGLIVGVTMAKAIALAHDLPLVGVNHLEAHALTVGLTDALAPPYLLLLVSGGHTQLQIVRATGRYERIGTTIDDALGEAFDKTAKLLGLGFPGGPALEQAALTGDAARFALPRPMAGRPEPHFSFAGLKTAIRHQAQKAAPLSDKDVSDLCAAFQLAVTDTVADRARRAMDLYVAQLGVEAPRHLVIAGGVAANVAIRTALEKVAAGDGFMLHAPPIALCGDNAAMIAWAGAERFVRGRRDGLDLAARARWPLDENATAMLGSGRLGTKA